MHSQIIVVQDVSEVCASRIPTKHEEDIGMQATERLEKIGELLKIIHLEVKDCKTRITKLQSRMESARGDVKNCGNNILSITNQIKAVEAVGRRNLQDVRVRVECMELCKADAEKLQLKAYEVLGEAEWTNAEVEARLRTLQAQQARLNEESQLLKSGGRASGMQPWPMYYPAEPPTENDVKYIAITVCSLCSFPFPNFDIVVASCLHIYHPWCALVIFGKGSKCSMRLCNGDVHPSWHQSFGWRAPSEEMKQKGLAIGLDAVQEQWQQERLEIAHDKLAGKCLGFRSLLCEAMFG